MNNKHELFDRYLKALCLLERWEFSDINDHIEDIEKISIKLIPRLNETLNQMEVDHKRKHLIASRLLDAMNDPMVYGQTNITSILMMASNNWTEFEELRNTYLRNTVHAYGEDDTFDFDELVKKFLREKQ